MSVSLTPSSALSFNRPFTQTVKRSLSVHNNNDEPVAFKVKTTAPKLYCVRPNSGRLEGGETVEVQVMLQAMKEDPPTSTVCKDKFLIQSVLITPEKDQVPLAELWSSTGDRPENRVHQQKLRVSYLPPEGQTVMEEPDESSQNISSLTAVNDSRFETVRDLHSHQANGIPEFDKGPLLQEPEDPVDRTFSPAANDYAPAMDEVSAPEPALAAMSAPAPPTAAAPAPEVLPLAHEKSDETPPAAAAAPISEKAPIKDVNAETKEKLMAAEAEIEQLRTLLAATPVGGGLRQGKTSKAGDFDDDGMEQAVMAPEGVHPQTVIIIAIAVFITTYLFF